MAIAKGVSLGPYEILTRLGEGGMGEVWRARDRRIQRDVAVKVLPESFSAAQDLVQRFEQEARTAGSLNHPGLVTIFDVGTTDGSPYIVMELLEGKTLRDTIGEGEPVALPLKKAIDYAGQIASALAVAHERGIVHRDLKPENVFITSDGRAKILDFGLAKLAADATYADGRKRSGKNLTSVGIVVGTPGYMSPEQVRADIVDHRSDIFSLGSVIYEMVTGRPAFDCFSAVETMHAVLNQDPVALTDVDPKIPAALEAIVGHCLEKNPRERFQSARDLAFQLRTLPEIDNTITGIRRLSRTAARPLTTLPYRGIAIGAAATLAVVAAIALFPIRRGGEQSTPRTYKQLTFGDGRENFPTLSPDGKSFAYVSSQSGNRDIYVQRVDGRAAINITSDSPDDDSEPAFSPDGSQIAFRSERSGGGIFVMGVTGESVRRLTDFGHNPSWSPDGMRIVVSTAEVELRPHIRQDDGELWIIDARDGARRPIVQEKVGGSDFGRESDAVQPSWSPHGKRIAFWGVSTLAGQRDLWTIDPNAPRPKQSVVRVTSDAALDWNPVWSPDGKYLYFGSDRDGTLNLWRIPMDEQSGKPTGAAEPVALPAAVSGNFAFSHQGEMAFTSVTRSFRLLALPFDAASGTTGAPRMLFGGSEEIMSFKASPDGQLIAFTTRGAQEDLFIANADGSRMRQLTNDPARDRDVVWSPDGRTLYFHSNRNGAYHIWRINTDGSGLARVTDEANLKRFGAKNIYTPQVSPDGRTLFVTTDRSQAFVHLDRPLAQRLEAIPGDLGLQRWSPDGQRIIGTMDRGVVIYSPGTRRSEIVHGRGDFPQWLPDGQKVVFFVKQNIGILDLGSRRETLTPLTPLPGVQLDYTSILSRDGATLYVRQTLEQGDIWMVRFERNDR